MYGSLPVCSCRIMLSRMAEIITVSRKLVIHCGYLDIASLDVFLQDVMLYFYTQFVPHRIYVHIFVLLYANTEHEFNTSMHKAVKLH